MEHYDFSGWATKSNIRCSDGRTILKDAFKDNDGKRVPLVWNHLHDDPEAVLGYADLKHRDEGTYAYCSFNDSDKGQAAKGLVKHGDVDSLSIWANQLVQHTDRLKDTTYVSHGDIKEVSLVLAGANIGAHIDNVIRHGEVVEDEADIFFGEGIELMHSDQEKEGQKEDQKEEEPQEDNNKMAENEKTVGDVLKTFNEEQKQVLYALIGEALKNKGADDNNDEDEGEEKVKHNAFDSEVDSDVLSHSEMKTIIDDGKKYGSMKESFLAHADDYGIQDIEMLFPEAHELNTTPEFIQRDTNWVATVMNSVHHSPFSRIKTRFADITEDEARAKGYIKGKLKKDEVFSLLKRSTQPTTVYKKQKMDRDDVNDITDFDVVSWIKGEMRGMLNEEIARAVLIGDGRLSSDDDKVDENCIRPILTDADLFVIRWGVKTESTTEATIKGFIRACIKSRKNYKGSGNPVMYTSEDILTEMLLLEDSLGHKLYKTEAELATALRVRAIYTVPQFDSLTVSVSGANKKVYAIIVNLADYSIGADKGGAVSMFEDFDIDYNQQKYLMETRCSGSLIKPFSAIVIREHTATESLEPTWEEAMEPFRPSSN